MTWFKVDDSFNSHPKALATDPAALGLWVLAGSWSGANLTDGFVPEHVLPRLVPADPVPLAKKLVAAGLWKRTRGGYVFHDWLEYNFSREEVERDRKSKAERQKRWREAQRRRVTDTPSNGVTDTPSNAPPVPSRPEGSSKEDPTRARARRPNTYNDETFRRFWEVYPKKAAKPHAFKAWKAALKRKHDPERIIVAAQRYRDDPKRNSDYTAHPATWLNGERYNDQAESQPNQSKPRPWWEN